MTESNVSSKDRSVPQPFSKAEAWLGSVEETARSVALQNGRSGSTDPVQLSAAETLMLVEMARDSLKGRALLRRFINCRYPNNVGWAIASGEKSGEALNKVWESVLPYLGPEKDAQP